MRIASEKKQSVSQRNLLPAFAGEYLPDRLARHSVASPDFSHTYAFGLKAANFGNILLGQFGEGVRRTCDAMASANAASKVLPTSSVHDHSDHREADLELRRKFVLFCASFVQSKDFENIGIGEFGPRAGGTEDGLSSKSRAERVKLVLAGCIPFQIFKRVIGFDSVDVIDLPRPRSNRLGQKSPRHQSVNTEILSVSHENNSTVPVWSRPDGNWLMIGCTSNVSKVRNFIRPAFDWFPDFFGVHSVELYTMRRASVNLAAGLVGAL